MKKYVIVVLALTLLCSCTDAEWSRLTTLGQRAEIICRSGGKITFHGISTGKVSNEKNSDGYFAKWKVVEAPDYIHAKVGEITPATLSSDCDIIYLDD
tara:strand:- start:4 stop:297 length:294 start_codon:yes stop_codon:yes gene_type:complete